MTVLADDPLIAGMAITHPLPLHESSGRLRELYPACPRVYGVAVMADVGRRRWWPLASALTTDRLRRMFVTAAGEMDAGPPRRSWPRRSRTPWRVGWSRWWSWKDGRGTRGWKTCGCTATPRAPSTGSASSTPPCGCCRTIPPAVTTSSGCRVRRPWPPGPRTGATGHCNRCSRGYTTSAWARWRCPRCGEWSDRLLSPPPHRFRCWPARRRPAECVADRRCWTRWPPSAFRCAGCIGKGCLIRQALPILMVLRRTDRAGVLWAAVTPGPSRTGPRGRSAGPRLVRRARVV